MNTIPQSETLLQDATNEVGHFLHKYRVSDILKRCNGYKQKGFPVIQLFTYVVALMFQPLSTYMSMRIGAYSEPFSKNTIRRFCNNAANRVHCDHVMLFHGGLHIRHQSIVYFRHKFLLCVYIALM